MQTKSKRFQIASQMEWEQASEGIRRQIMGYDGQLMIVKVEFSKGAVAAIHTHYHSQASFVVSGKYEVTIEGQSQIVGPGDGFYIEPDEVHGAVCLEAGVLIDTFSPHRADFLAKK